MVVRNLKKIQMSIQIQAQPLLHVASIRKRSLKNRSFSLFSTHRATHAHVRPVMLSGAKIVPAGSMFRQPAASPRPPWVSSGVGGVGSAVALGPGRDAGCLKKLVLFQHGLIFSGCSLFWVQKVVFANSTLLLLGSWRVSRGRLMKPQRCGPPPATQPLCRQTVKCGVFSSRLHFLSAQLLSGKN